MFLFCIWFKNKYIFVYKLICVFVAVSSISQLNLTKKKAHIEMLIYCKYVHLIYEVNKKHVRLRRSRLKFIIIEDNKKTIYKT